MRQVPNKTIYIAEFYYADFTYFLGNYTYSPKGEKRVKATSSGNERTRLSAAFTAVANGTKLPIYTIIPRKKPLQFDAPLPMVQVEYQTNSIFNEDVIIGYIKRIVIPYKLQMNLDLLLLIIDSATSHTTPRVESFLHDNKIKLLLIPPRMTNLLQPADVGWFSSIKKAYRAKWNNWFIYEKKKLHLER